MNEVSILVLPPLLRQPSVYTIPATGAANKVLAWSADGSALAMRSITVSMISDIGTAANHPDTYFALATDLAAKAPLASPALTGSPTTPTATVGTNTTQIASTAFVRGEVSALVNGATSTLDTLGEIGAQLASDESAAAALATTVGGKLAKASNLSDLPSAATARANLGLNTVVNYPATLSNAYGYLPLDSSGNAVGRWLPRSGTDSAMSTLVGLAGEVTVSTDTHIIRLHDGTLAGGVVFGGSASVTLITANLATQSTPGTIVLPNSTGTNLVYTIDDTRSNPATSNVTLPTPQFAGQRALFSFRNGTSAGMTLQSPATLWVPSPYVQPYDGDTTVSVGGAPSVPYLGDSVGSMTFECVAFTNWPGGGSASLQWLVLNSTMPGTFWSGWYEQ